MKLKRVEYLESDAGAGERKNQKAHCALDYRKVGRNSRMDALYSGNLLNELFTSAVFPFQSIPSLSDKFVTALQMP